MTDPTTPFLGLIKPVVNDEAGEDLWGDKLNGNFDKLDASSQDMAGDITVLQASAIPEAPVDGKPYGRQDASWFDVSSLPTSWDAITGKPSTFPPELPIPQIGVTGLVADQATQNNAINANTTAINGKEPTIAPGTSAQFWRGDKTWQPLSSITVDAYTKAEADARFEPFDSAWTKAEADARFAPIVHTHTITDVTGLTAALAGKEPTIAAGTTAQYWRGDKTWQTHDKASVGLGNVDNTSDASKPVSTATQAALDLKVSQTSVTGAADIPAGTTAQRPAATSGRMRFNSETLSFEGYNGTTWAPLGGGVYVGTSFPALPRHGDLAWRSDLGLMFIFYNDGTSSQWVVTQPAQDTAALDARYALGPGVAGCFKLGSGGPTPTTVAQVDIPIPLGYPGGYELRLNGIAPDSNSQAPIIRFSADGTTFLAANYAWALYTTNALATATGAPAGASSSGFIALNNAQGSALGTRFQCQVQIGVPPAGAVPSVTFQGHMFSSASNYAHVVGGGTITVGITGVPLAIRLLSTSGLLAPGLSWQLNGFK